MPDIPEELIERLPPCPICGAPPDHGYAGGEDGGYGFVQCDKSGAGCHFVGFHEDDEETAAANWRKAFGPAALTAPPMDEGQFEKFDPNNPAHDPREQLRLLANGISRAVALLAVDERGDRSMRMPEWVLRQWIGYATRVDTALSRTNDPGRAPVGGEEVNDDDYLILRREHMRQAFRRMEEALERIAGGEG